MTINPQFQEDRSAKTDRTGGARLIIKFLIVVLPLYIICVTSGLFIIADHNARTAEDEMIARLGSLSASTAAKLEQAHGSGDMKLSQALLEMLLGDRAIKCAEIRGKSGSAVSMRAPRGLGCTGIDNAEAINISIGENDGSELHVRYDSAEVYSVIRAQRDFTGLALIAGLVIVIAACFLGFQTTIGRPLKSLMRAIEGGTATTAVCGHIPNDELGTVMRAYNQAQERVEASKVVLERQFAEIQARHAEMKTILDHMPHSVMWIDKDRTIKQRSGRVTDVHCIDEQDYRHVTTFRDHVAIIAARGDLGPFASEQEAEDLIEQRVRLLCDEKDLSRSIRIHFPSKQRWMEVRVAALKDGGCILGQYDITEQVLAEQSIEAARSELELANKALKTRMAELVQSQAKIEFLAHFDHLTGLLNRYKFQQELESGLGGNNPLGALLCLDLDGFKSVNDFNGHAAGDELIRQVGGRLKSVVRATDIVARRGGDEFAIALFGPVAEKTARRLASELIEELSREFDINGAEIRIGVSIGITLVQDSADSGEDLLTQADLALYDAKRAGKGQYRVYDPAMEEARRRNLEIENRLRFALRDEDLDVHFQPQANSHTNEITGFEALARWTDPLLGQIGPDEFIPVAEQCGLVRQLGQQVLRKACEIAATWPPQYRVAVNLSAAEFANPDLVESVESTLSATGLDPHRLELEITESVLIQDEELAMQSIRHLKKLGISIAIDDFGTGYSSLSFLQIYQFDRIKIDKSFVQQMVSNPEAALIVQTIVNLSRGLEISVLAEGVECDQVLQELRRVGCDEVQGYFLGKPVPQEELAGFIERPDNVVAIASRA